MTENITFEQCIPLPLSDDKLLEVAEKAKDWAIMHGAAMRSKSDFSPNSFTVAPFLLTPSSIPRRQFKEAVALQTTFNRLMYLVAHDEEFLTVTLAETVKVDEFTRNLFDIYKKVLASGIGQSISLAIVRSDLMLQSQTEDLDVEGAHSTKTTEPYAQWQWKQVEINTIASGFGHLGPASRAIQSYVLHELDYSEKLRNMPENKALEKICDGMIQAWNIYANDKAVIMFVVEDVSYNICDQRFHEFYIRTTCPHIKVIRRTLTQISDTCKLSSDKKLFVADLEVAVIYYRAGYEPAHYHSQKEWDARYLMECSKAIKCPSIQYHLAGTKKVQQALAQPDVLARFIKDPVEFKNISKIFTGLYALDDNEIGHKNYEMALQQPQRFVLKPQREGGGNNVYGIDIPEVLQKMSITERSAWILMDLIKPPILKSYMIRPDGALSLPSLIDVVCELGIFGVIIADNDNIMCNYQAGHMLRTKIATANEGGVAAGLGALDSPYLVD